MEFKPGEAIEAIFRSFSFHGIFIIVGIFYISIVGHFSPESFQLSWREIVYNFQFYEAAKVALAYWPVFLAIPFLILLRAILTKNEKEKLEMAEEYLIGGLIISIGAAFIEEVFYRLILILALMPGIRFGDFCTGGVIWGHGLVYLFSEFVGKPVTNFLTFYQFTDFFKSYEWYVGAAFIIASMQFRRGHAYQGLLGFINCWYMGLGLTLIAIKCGLVPAMMIHALFNVIQDLIMYTDRKVESMRLKS